MRESLEKVFAVLDVIASSGGPVSLKSIAAQSGHNASTLSRILSDLVEMGYVRKEGYRDFALDLGLIPLGQEALANFPLPRIANPLIKEATDRLEVSGALLGMHRERLVYLYRTGQSDDAETLAKPFHYALHKSHSGMVLLASFPEKEAVDLLKGSLLEDSFGKTVPTSQLKGMIKTLMKIRSDGYHYVSDKDGWNVTFPIKDGDRTFCVSLHGKGEPPQNAEAMTLECSLLARKIEEAIKEKASE